VESGLKKQAFLRIEIFKKVLEYYKGSNLPDMKYLGFYSRICGWDWGSSGKFAGESVGVNPSASDGTSRL
jgi:hypothetical protein